MVNFWQNDKSKWQNDKGIFTDFRYFWTIWDIDIIVDSEQNDVIIFAVACLVAELFISRNHKTVTFNGLTSQNISTTVHGTIKSLVPFCSAQDDESNDINCLVFWAQFKNGQNFDNMPSL